MNVRPKVSVVIATYNRAGFLPETLDSVLQQKFGEFDLSSSFRILIRYPVACLDGVVFYYRKHEANIGRNQELRLVENIRVIEKLLRDFPQAGKILGPARVARRLAYRYYRLAKGRWRDGRKEGARDALRQAVTLSPFALKYRLYPMRWA